MFIAKLQILVVFNDLLSIKMANKEITSKSHLSCYTFAGHIVFPLVNPTVTKLEVCLEMLFNEARKKVALAYSFEFL